MGGAEFCLDRVFLHRAEPDREKGGNEKISEKCMVIVFDSGGRG